MDASKLTPKQRHKLQCGAADRRDWYHKLRERMDAAGWAKDDPVYLAVVAAWDAGHAVVRAVAASEAKQAAAVEERPAWLSRLPTGPARAAGLPDV